MIYEIYAGVEQADGATLTTGGITYRCSVWKAAAQRIEYAIEVDGEDGQVVHIDGGTLATLVGDLVDTPRVLVTGARFVAHWIDAGTDENLLVDSAAIHRALYDVTDIPGGWSNQGSIPTYETCQYDHAAILESVAEQFIVSHRTASGTITTIRYQSPWSWVDIVWTVQDTGLTIADTVLACHAHEGDNAVLISYQDTLLLRTIRRNSVGGGGSASAETFADLTDGNHEFVAVTHVRYGTGTYLVGCEATLAGDDLGDEPYVRLVGWRAIQSSDAGVLHESQWVWGLHLLSRLWTHATGTTGQNEAYAALSFKSIRDGGEFDEMRAFIVKLGVPELAGANAAGVIRPIPVSAIMGGSVDGRPHGVGPTGSSLISIGTRVNHIPHVSGPPQYTLGPRVKSVSFPCIRWGRLVAIEDSGRTELQPVEAGVGRICFKHEPPWTVRRDTREPTQPDTPAWRGVSDAMSLPVLTPAGLVLTGGVTQAYDGQQVSEIGFFWCEILAAEPVTMGTIGDNATYTWTVNAVWKDARGNVHRGPPSRPVSAEVDANEFARLTIRCITLGMHDDTRRYPLAQPIHFEVWRTYVVDGSFVTEGSGALTSSLFRSEFGGNADGWLVHQLPANDPAAHSITVDVGRANSIVRYNELAPHQLNTITLQWTPPPPIPHQPLGASCFWQGRVFGVDLETGSLTWSEEVLPSGSRWEWPRWLDTNVFPMSGLGKVTALVPVESDMAILSRDGIDTINGDPGAGGSGNTFQLRTVARGIGCIEPRSVCTFTDGFTFQSAKGRIHVFTRGAGLEDIGAPIEDFLREAGNVRSAVYLEDRDEIRFTFQEEPGTGPLLVRPRIAIFNLRSKFWVIRNLPMVAQSSTASRLNEMMHACAWRGRQGETVHVVLAQGGLLIERSSTSTVYSDEDATGTTTIRLDCTTEWIHLGLDETKRFHEIGIQTERIHEGGLTIQAWYDHDGTWDSDEGAAQQTLALSAAQATDFIRFRPEQGKCRGIKLRIFEPSGVAATENVRFVALVLHYSLKKQRQGSRNNAG